MNIPQIPPVVLLVLLVWSLFWKGIALWHAATLKQKNWFVVMLVLNTVGLTEIAYLFFFAKRRFDFASLLFWRK